MINTSLLLVVAIMQFSKIIRRIRHKIATYSQAGISMGNIMRSIPVICDIELKEVLQV